MAVVLAVLACLPYLALKVTWIAGGELGIPSGSALLDPDNVGTMRAVNALTVAMDFAVIVLALALTRPWGRRVPAVLLAGPVWVATGLLTPIVVGFPIQLLAGLVAESGTANSSAEPFLDPWVFSVVYGGFMLQALALAILFVTYAGDRWGRLWRGRVSGLAPTPALPALRTTAVLVAVLALPALTMQLLWATGSVVGLPDSMAEDRGLDQVLAHVPHVVSALAAPAGLLILAFGLAPKLPLWVPVLVAWVGSSATACWAAWSVFATLVMPKDEGATSVMGAVHAGYVLVGVIVAVAGMHFLVERHELTSSRLRGRC